MRTHVIFQKINSGWRFKAIESPSWNTVATPQMLRPLGLRHDTTLLQRDFVNHEYFQCLHDAERSQAFMARYPNLFGAVGFDNEM